MYEFIGLTGVVALIAVVVLVKRMLAPGGSRSAAARPRRRSAAPRTATAPAPTSAHAASEVNAEPATPVAVAAVPAAIDKFRLIDEWELPSVRKEELLVALRTVAKPPGSIKALLSPKILAGEDANELIQFILREPIIAAKVLAAVNSPLYGLTTPIVSAGQAVTFLGLTTVRNVVLQTLTRDSFKAGDPALQRVCDGLWNCATIASEICHRVAQRMGMANPGALSTQALLSYFGDFAVLTLFAEHSRRVDWQAGLLARTVAEQRDLGVNARTLGCLLMRDWHLPDEIVDGVLEDGRVLVTPPECYPPQRAARLAVCYASTRLGERIAFGNLRDLSGFNFRSGDEPDYFYLNRYLARPELSRFYEHLHAQETCDIVRRYALEPWVPSGEPTAPRAPSATHR